MSKTDVTALGDSGTRRGSAIHKTSSKGGFKSSSGTGRSNGRGVGTNGTNGSGKADITSNKQSSKGGNSEVGQQYFKQYFKQKKNSNYIQINNKYGAQGGPTGYQIGKYAQVDSPKDNSIERARNNDMI